MDFMLQSECLLINPITVYTVNLEIFANSRKRHICNVKNLQLGHDLHISVNNKVILPFREGFIFMKLRILFLFKCMMMGQASDSKTTLT